MPFLNVKICALQSAVIGNKVTAFLTQHTAAILGKKTELISVAIEYIPLNQWAIGGELLANQAQASFYLEIKVTEGTNTKNEKATYIQKVFAEFETLLGALNPASYIVINDVRADSWGYAGASQEFRYIKSKGV